MKKLLVLMTLVMLSVLPALVLAIDVGTGISPDITTEDFEPQVWMCDSRVVLDDDVEPGRLIGPGYSDDFSSYTLYGEELLERVNNYAFEGEQIAWDVLVFDKNGIEKIEDVFVTIGDVEQGPGNDIEVNCVLDYVLSDQDSVPSSCNARILEEEIYSFQDNVAALYKCILTVETPDSMDTEYWVTVEATDLDGLSGTFDENEYWYFNPVIALSIDGDLTFDEVRPGTSSYSSTLLVGNDAADGSGVLLDMFISGTDFYDSTSSGAKCPISNELKLGDGDSTCDVGPDFGGGDSTTDAFCYYATHGAYSTQNDGRNDAEGYVGINYGDTFNAAPFGGNWYGAANGDATGYEILQHPNTGLVYFPGNVVSPGSEIAITFRLNLPEPCNGDFDTGSIYFWGEAI